MYMYFFPPEFPFDLSAYINNESLRLVDPLLHVVSPTKNCEITCMCVCVCVCVCSDCVLVSSDGEKFHAHKLVLCAQSGVFRSMLESEHWVDSRQGNQVSCLGWRWMTSYSSMYMCTCVTVKFSFRL